MFIPIATRISVRQGALLPTLLRSGGIISGREGRAVSDFKERHFEGEIVLWAVRWYCRYGIISIEDSSNLTAVAWVTGRIGEACLRVAGRSRAPYSRDLGSWLAVDRRDGGSRDL